MSVIRNTRFSAFPRGREAWMHGGLLWALVVACILLFPPDTIGGESPGQASASGEKDTLWLIPHTHWEEALFRSMLAQGRLQIVGGTDVTVGWQLDTFGHHAQMPQILKLAGYKSFWFFRGVPRPDVPSEFLWQGLDGSQIPAFWTPLGYAVGYGSPKPAKRGK